MAADIDDAAEEVGDNLLVRALARVGLVAYGVVHLLIGWTAVRLAWGAPDPDSADSAGAMRLLAQQPFGSVLLASVAIGLLALALWQATEVIVGARHDPTFLRIRKKATSAGRAVVYASLAASAISVTLRSPGSGSMSEQQATSGVLAWPCGPVLVALGGLVTIGVGVTLMVKGAKVDIREEIDLHAMPRGTHHVAIRLGQAGYVTKGLALAVVGALLGYVAVTSDGKEQGLDGALRAILGQPFGRFLVTAVAVGFVAFGLYWMLQSRFRRL